jgi:hypothetical protein
MASLFDKDPASSRPPTNLERIEKEIKHLKKRTSVRDGRATTSRLSYLIVLAVLAILGLYLLDPILYALKKDDAIHAYLYLHDYGNVPELKALVDTGMFASSELTILNRRQGTAHDYYTSLDQANKTAASIVQYVNGVHALHAGKYQELDAVGKMRYLLFVHNRIPLPTSWSFLTPIVTEPDQPAANNSDTAQ